MTRPLVIGHRGASGYRPEHTALAYRMAWRMGADSVEPDLVVTRDGVLLCRHDVELSGSTDVADRPEYAHRLTSIEVEGRQVEGWFVHDFDLAEIRTLKARERWPNKRPHSALFDDQLDLVTFEDLLRLRETESGRRGVPLRVHAEVKHPRWLTERGLPVEDLLVEVIRRHGLDNPQRLLTVMSFEPGLLQALAARTRVPLVQLLEISGRPADGGAAYRRMNGRKGLTRIAEYAGAIGPHKHLVLPRDRGDQVHRAGDLVAKAHDRGLDVLVWTLRNENRHLPANLRRGLRQRRHGDAAAEITMLLDAGVDGLLTDFPDTAVATIAAQSRPIAL
ncbi:MAG: glycerophosphodiester phosphodiesterase [Actinomycetota bacterium]|nr:glycerophosphodiester phosphodiesterase [Actinomycetota bacterium]